MTMADPLRISSVARFTTTSPGASGPIRGRLEQMADLLGTMDGVADRLLRDPESSRNALAFIAGAPFGAGRKGRR